MTDQEKIEAIESICDDAAAVGNDDALIALLAYVDARQKAIESRLEGLIDLALDFEGAADGTLTEMLKLTL